VIEEKALIVKRNGGKNSYRADPTRNKEQQKEEVSVTARAASSGKGQPERT
jgi:hypothetical protein